MISAASIAGANIAKFQTFNADLVLKTSSKANYQLKNSRKKSLVQNVKNLQLKNDHFSLIKHCKKFNIEFLSTGFDIKSLNFVINRFAIL